MTKFIILTRQRTGSTVFSRSLNNHSKIICVGEIFYNGKFYKELKFPFINTFKNHKLLHNFVNFIWGLLKTNAHLTKFYNNTVSNDTQAIGFKLMLYQTRLFPLTKKWLNNKEIKKIVLVRHNPLDIYISEQRAKTFGRAHVEVNEKLIQKKIKLNTKNLLKKLKKIEKENHILTNFAKRNKTLLIQYEDFPEWDKMIAKVIDFLGVEKENLDPVLQKRSKGHIEDDIENYKELIGILKNTPFEKYL